MAVYLLRNSHNQGGRKQEDSGGIISPHPLDHFANLGVASRAPGRRGSPKPSQVISDTGTVQSETVLRFVHIHLHL